MNDNKKLISELPFKNSKIEIIKECEVGEVGDECTILFPNRFNKEENTGFIAINTINDMYFGVIEYFDEEELKISDTYYDVLYDYETFLELFKVIN